MPRAAGKSTTRSSASGPRSPNPAVPHQRTRQAHETETAEDYVEIIADLIESAGQARVTDIARRLGVSHVTVIRTVSRIQDKGWVTTRPYRSIILTDAGRKLAEKTKRRHQIVLDFLKAMGIADSVARIDAEGIEHHVSKETLAAFERFVQRFPGRP